MNETIKHALDAYKPVEAQIRQALPNVDDYLINGLFDDEGYKAAKSALRQSKSAKSAIEAKRKELKAIALEYGRAVDSEAKRLIEIVEPTVTALEQRIAAIDIEKERLRNEQRDRRTKEMTEIGYEFSMGAYRIGAEVIHPSALDSASDEDWAMLMQRGRAAAEQERQRREEDERRRQELAELREMQARIEAERAELERMRNPQPEPEQQPEPAEVKFTPEFVPEHTPSPEYIAGFNAMRSLAIVIVQRAAKRNEMIHELNEVQP
jgi:hypothetical protein